MWALLALWVGDIHLSLCRRVCVCVCVNDFGSLWDRERRTWHVANKGSTGTNADQQMLEKKGRVGGGRRTVTGRKNRGGKRARGFTVGEKVGGEEFRDG